MGRSKNGFLIIMNNTPKKFSLYPAIMSVPTDIQTAKGRTKVQALSRLARQAAQVSAHKALGRPLSGFPKDDDGVPQPMDGIHWSLSHKSALVAGMVARHPIGIDVEFRRPVKSGMHMRIATTEEWRLGQTSDADAARVKSQSEGLFFRFWTAKEAVLKAVGQGIVGLSNCRITALPSPTCMTLAYHADPWQVVQHWYGDHLVAVAYQSSLARGGVEIHWPEV
jgi:4'-phosphopantetheinyl transferase